MGVVCLPHAQLAPLPCVGTTDSFVTLLGCFLFATQDGNQLHMGITTTRLYEQCCWACSLPLPRDALEEQGPELGGGWLLSVMNAMQEAFEERVESGRALPQPWQSESSMANVRVPFGTPAAGVMKAPIAATSLMLDQCLRRWWLRYLQWLGKPCRKRCLDQSGSIYRETCPDGEDGDEVSTTAQVRDVFSVRPTEGRLSWKFWVGGCPNTPSPPPVGVGHFWDSGGGEGEDMRTYCTACTLPVGTC